MDLAHGEWPSSVIFRRDELLNAKAHSPISFYTCFRELFFVYDADTNVQVIASHLERLVASDKGYIDIGFFFPYLLDSALDKLSVAKSFKTTRVFPSEFADLFAKAKVKNLWVACNNQSQINPKLINVFANTHIQVNFL
jgi:hypothetical protein